MAGAKYELEGGRSIALISGSGSLGAGSPKLINANWYQQKTYQRTALGEQAGDPHPSRGAISPLFGKSPSCNLFSTVIIWLSPMDF